MEVRGLNISEKKLTLYAVTDRKWLQDGQTLAGQVEQAILGGVTWCSCGKNMPAQQNFWP